MNWSAALSAGAFGFVTAILLALTGLPEAEEKRMNTTINEMAMKELNLDELETVNGGIDWDLVSGIGWTSGGFFAAITSITICCISGPIGWSALAGVGAAGVLGAVTGGGITAMATDDD